MKRKIKKRIALVIGLCLCTYPLVSGMLERYEQRNVISTYETTISNQEEEMKQCVTSASEYNDMLYQSKGAMVGNLQTDLLSSENYETELNLTGTGMMGTLEIPKISVYLPIYHGTDEEVLSNGVGHIEGTSLPVGGEHTHSVLTGHRGLPSSKLFTRLDELEEGDLFYLRVCDETFAYQVNSIQVVKPEDVEILKIIPEKDLVSLVTCHPYGINSHRLVVTGERISYSETEYLQIDAKMPSVRELFFAGIPIILFGIVVISIIKERKERSKNAQKETNN